MKKRLNNNSIKIIFLLVMLALLYFSFYDYSFQNEKRIEYNLKSIIEENNQQTNIVVSDKLDDQISILEAYATVISLQEDIISDQSFKQLEPLLQKELFTRIAITNKEGISYTSDHYQHDSSQREYFLEGKKGNTFISNILTSAIDHTDVVIMSVPIYQDNQFAGVLRATLNVNFLQEYFDLPVLSGNVLSYIIQNDGLNLTKQQEYETNFFTMLEKNNNQFHVIEEMKKDLSLNQKGSITFTLSGKTRYAYYSPIEHTDWFMLTILPQTIVQEEMDDNLQKTIFLALKIGAIVISTCAYFVYLQYQGACTLKKVNKRMDTIISNTPGSHFKHDVSHPETIVFFKDNHQLLAGYTKEEIVTKISTDIYSLIFKEDYEALLQSLKNLQPQVIVSNTYRIKSKNHEIRWIFDQRQIIQEDRQMEYYVEVIDITELKRAQEELMVTEERYRMILKETESVIFDWDAYTDKITFSDLWTNKYGYPKQLDNFLVLTHKLFSHEENTYVPLIENIVAGKIQSDQIECILPLANGQDIWVKIYAKAIVNQQGYLLRIVGSISDISQEKQKALQLLERAQKDGLTQVYNRMTLENLITKELNDNENQCYIMFVIDIDDFKIINDTLGHTSGDEALMKFTDVLMSNFRKNDIIGRLGGDEFVVFIRYPHQNPKYQIERKCENFLSDISKIRLTKDAQYCMHCSIGVALYPNDGMTYSQLFECADKNLYQAKKKGKNRYIYSDMK